VGVFSGNFIHGKMTYSLSNISFVYLKEEGCSQRKEKKNQHWAIQREFEPVGSIMLKNPLGAGWGLQPTLRWVGSCL
jgi:hypothetical protein